MDVSEKDEEVASVLTEYANHLERGEYQSAFNTASELLGMDCGVCQRFGEHLAAASIAAETSLSEVVASKLAEAGVESARSLRDEVVLAPPEVE